MSDLVELCQKLVQFQSVGNNCTEALLFLKNFLEQNNFSARIVDFEAEGKKVSNLCASFGSGKPHLLFVGHIDVVPANDISLWQFSPFAAKIENNILYGRGIADMKGGIACFLQACRDFTQNNDFSGKITLIISGDEEEPIVEGSKKMLKLLSDEQEYFDFAIVGEPSNPLTMGDEIKIGRRGDMVLNITSYGQSGHTAYADVSSNPVHNLVNLLYALQHDKLDDGNAYFAPSSLHITTIDVNNKASNVVPNKAFAQIDIRFNSEHTFADIEQWLQQHIEQTSGQFTYQAEYVGESFLSPINDHIENLRKIIQQHTGKIPTYSTAGGTSDARFVKNYCPVVEYGLTNKTIHKNNECEDLANIATLYNVYKDFLAYFFCGDK